ncbi:hypothetical protein ACIQU5_16155 [Streptomyces sp. NPDC090306]|uniref:hypothetical protein n=1 Tax=Streptomyces sp. NPDC090306 TaxID=3365961 RepID=UPI0037F8F56F
MTITVGTRSRAVLASLGVLALALAAAVTPAHAADTTPPTPTQPFNGNRACSTEADQPTFVHARSGLTVEAVPGAVGATGSPRVTVTFQAWPVDDPTQITTATHTNASPGWESDATFPATALTDGETYAWRARTETVNAASDWTAACFVTIDNTSPAAPAVASPNYPQGGAWTPPGHPAEFTLDAGGDTDVTGFEFSWYRDLPVIGTSLGDYGVPQVSDPFTDTAHFVRADASGSTAHITLIPPYTGTVTLSVRSLDRALNVSAVSDYVFRIGSAAPTVTRDVESPEFGDEVTFTLHPAPGLQAISPTIGYALDITGIENAPTEVTADADGTASLTLTLDGASGVSLRVSGRSANGWISDSAYWSTSYDSTPTVASDIYPEYDSGGGVGITGSFTFAPTVKNVVSYTYAFSGEPEVTVPADAGHTATVAWAPSAEGSYDLLVYATTESAARTESAAYTFWVE